ncbi:MAG: type II toxin-antitoxin system MqsR family toxin [Deltaproteobacteria bacterium]|nr:type II toxin-antitoxin system MqsR family toxin [Deltaproteobacteria bacterium]
MEQKSYLLTNTSRQTAHNIGFSQTEIIDTISGLEAKDFYKSTTEFYKQNIWQDVYKPTAKGYFLYVKFKITKDKIRLIITSFKRAEEDFYLHKEKRYECI